MKNSYDLDWETKTANDKEFVRFKPLRKPQWLKDKQKEDFFGKVLLCRMTSLKHNKVFSLYSKRHSEGCTGALREGYLSFGDEGSDTEYFAKYFREINSLCIQAQKVVQKKDI